ncbi:MAG: GxxExxY protein [Verrucomicrobia bacterium]|nr:MAG: GxxExxY protein [Verrucomicrobiota bacterium]PYL21725.1 MAG: GxxExxY protein [Verrucomicrobiota bacterium]
MEEESKEYDLCGQVIGAAMKVHSTLGPGFLESVYQNALIWELRKAGLRSEAEKPIRVHYDGQLVGAFTADVLVDDAVIVELKAIQTLAKAHEVQLVNYLVATVIDEGLLVNFGAERLEYKRKFRLPKREQASL